MNADLRRLRQAAMLIGIAATSLHATAQQRGQLLYETHCISCHTTQVHWRERRLASDWTSLKAQVSRWQNVASLGWTEQDVVDVARHLNHGFYGFEEPVRPAGAPLPPSPAVARQ